MDSKDVVPTTIEGIKRLAKRIRREQGIQYMRALDEAAHRAGFSNYTSALRALPSNQPKVNP